MKKANDLPPPLSDKDILNLSLILPAKFLIDKNYPDGYTERVTLWAEEVVKADLTPLLIGWPDGINSLLEYEYFINVYPDVNIPEHLLIEIYHNAYKVIQNGEGDPKATIKIEVGSYKRRVH